MAETSIQPSLFTYDSLDPADSAWLKQQEAAILDYCRRTLADHVAAGKILLSVKAKHPRYFKPWLEAKTALSRSTAYNLMAVAEKFETLMEALSAGRTQHIEVKALYALAEKNVSDDARAAAVEQAVYRQQKKLEPISFDEARDLIHQHPKKSPRQMTFNDVVGQYAEKYEKQFQKKYEAERREIFDETRAAPPIDTRESRFVKNLEELCRITTALNFSTVDDPDAEETLYCVRAIFRDRDRQTPSAAVRADVIDAIAALLGREEQKECPQCGQVRPISWFVQNRTKIDGRASECKDCSRGRVRRAKQKAKQSLAA